MDTIIINNDKIKVMLCREEMQKYSLEEKKETDVSETERAIRNILDDVSAHTGFNIERGSFYVQIYPSKKGGCEMFITRIYIPKLEDINETEKNSQKKEKCPDMKQAYRKEEAAVTDERGRMTPFSLLNGRFIYRFDNFETMLRACREISISGKCGMSDAFYDRTNENCYLVLENDSFHACEFGGEKRPKKDKFYISEHCELICHGAVPLLQTYAV